MHVRTAMILALTAVCGCGDDPSFDDEETRLPCAAGDAMITSSVFAPGTGQTVSGDLTITGAARHSLGLTIREIKVLGIPAENTGFNFGSWKATIPFTLLGAIDGDVTQDGRKVLLDIVASEVCSGLPQEVIVPEEDAIVYVEPNVPLGALTVKLVHEKADYLPPGGTPAATLTLTGTPEIGGAKVQLDAAGVLFDEVSDRTSKRLDASGNATVRLRSKHLGENSITIRSGEDITGALLRVGGRPLLSPSAAALQAGQSVLITGRTEGDIATIVTCTASGSTYATVKTAAGVSLATEDGVSFDLASGAAIEFIVRAADVVAPELVTISCKDAIYGQAGTTVAVTIE